MASESENLGHTFITNALGHDQILSGLDSEFPLDFTT